MRYDEADDSSQCNTMPVGVVLASSSEPYISSTCAGIASEVFIPSGA
jgi:hypothetical protein